MEEIWKDIRGYEGLYQVSNLGNVKSIDRVVWMKRNNCYKTIRGVVLRKSLNGVGYYHVSLSSNGKSTSHTIHKLVAINFLRHKPSGFSEVIDHINNIKTDNRVENLQVVTQQKNVLKSSKRTGKYPYIYWIESRSRYMLRFRFKGKQRTFGYFKNRINAVIRKNEILCESI